MQEIFDLIDVVQRSEFFELAVAPDSQDQDLVSHSAFLAENSLPSSFFAYFELDSRPHYE